MTATDMYNGVFSVFFNGLFMFVAVYWPRIFGNRPWSNIVFTVNFLAVAINLISLAKGGVL